MPHKFHLFFIFLLISLCACGQLDKETNIHFEKATKLFNNKEYESALIYVDKVIEKYPTDYFSWTLKGRILFNLRKDAEALKALDKAIELNPKYYEAYGHRAVLCSSIGKCSQNQIINDFDMALIGKPNDTKLIERKAYYLYKSGLFIQCIEECNKIFKFEPNNYYGFMLRAPAYKKLGKNELALKDYNQAIDINPKENFAYAERGLFFTEQEKYDEAVKDFDKSLELISKKNNDPDFLILKAYDLNNRGFAYFKLGNAEKALIDMNTSLELLSTNSYAYKNRALVYLSKREKNKGCADLQKALELGYTQKYGDEVEVLIKKYCK
ncbi:hypothetical protein AD998_14035 [bacterium 336/3]|nr:hypothetical protein AD998_14035 [bacterium 336/3]